MTATFTDGTQHTSDILIGAEGSRSVTRAYLVGEEKAKNIPPPVGMAMARPHLTLEAVEEFKKLGERLWIAFHPDGGYALMIGTDAIVRAC